MDEDDPAAWPETPKTAELCKAKCHQERKTVDRTASSGILTTDGKPRGECRFKSRACMSEEFYYHFRRVDTASGPCISLSVFDLSDDKPVGPGADVKLKLNGSVIAKPRPREEACYPEVARAGNLLPVLYFESLIRDFEDVIQSSVNRIECIGADGRLLSESAVFALPGVDDFPVPDESNIMRVAGKTKAGGFLVGGACWYTLFQDILDSELGGLKEDDPVLDWGVGCGRIARYFLLDGYTNLHGIDIDQKNIDWCVSNLPSAQFSRCDFDPPSSCDDNTFKAIYGHSVFTHLNEDSEIAWLQEIGRLLSPDGVACCTISSELSCKMVYNTQFEKRPDLLKPLLSAGRQDFGADAAGVDEGRDGYYRLVSHTRQYIHDTWSKYVDVKRIIPGFANNQDAVIFTKKR